MLNMNEDREMELFAKLAKEISYELDVDASEVQDIIADWAVDSHSHNAIMLQIAAKKEFGATLSEYTAKQAQKSGMNIDGDMALARSILRFVYDRSPRHPITVYRATDFDGTNALESWTKSREIAEFYVMRNGGGQVIEKTTDRYLSCQGFGLECAEEVVVIN